MEAASFDFGDLAGQSVWEIGKHPFHLVWPNARVYEVEDDQYPHLPLFYLHGSLYIVGECDTRAILWKCASCNWWCNVLDQRIQEEHLIIRCLNIDPTLRKDYLRRVIEQMSHHASILSQSK